MTLNFEAQTKVKVPRGLFVSWIEAAIDEVHKAQRLNMDIRRVFQKCGLDPYDNDNYSSKSTSNLCHKTQCTTH